ncbi:MAG TPA: LysE family translocator [Oceanospirillaceae bacterium]|nr:LysE family translocator [Oceanospirillaceae bacterium]
MSFESALTFLAAIFIFGITPGPGVFAILARALLHGARSCLALSLGMIVSDIVYLVAACFGLAALATHWGEVFMVVRIVGALYLVYLGYLMWTAPVNLDVNANDNQQSKRMGFLQGFLISASNPKVILFYIAFLPTFIDLTVLSAADIALASGLTFVGLLTGLMLIAMFASKARNWFKSERAMKGLNRSAGSLMIGAAAYLASRS